jgi:hypothetical protein
MDRETLMELRRLRLDAQYHNAKAAEYMERATHGTSTRRANQHEAERVKCPVSDYAVATGASKRRLSYRLTPLRDLGEGVPGRAGAGREPDYRAVLQPGYGLGQTSAPEHKRNIDRVLSHAQGRA